MLDINESVGKSSCSSLQKEFSANDVMFTKVDVTRSEDLVNDSQYSVHTVTLYTMDVRTDGCI